MDCEHFLFNGEAKYDVRVLAPVLEQLYAAKDSQHKIFIVCQTICVFIVF